MIIDEDLAKRAHEMNSMYDYKPGSATAEYNGLVEKARRLVDNRGRGEIVRLLDDDGEVTHTLESRGDGAYFEDGTPFGWCAAALEAYDSEGDFLQFYTLGYITEFDAKRWTY